MAALKSCSADFAERAPSFGSLEVAGDVAGGVETAGGVVDERGVAAGSGAAGTGGVAAVDRGGITGTVWGETPEGDGADGGGVGAAGAATGAEDAGGATVVGAADEKELNGQLDFILEEKILLEKDTK